MVFCWAVLFDRFRALSFRLWLLFETVWLMVVHSLDLVVHSLVVLCSWAGCVLFDLKFGNCRFWQGLAMQAYGVLSKLVVCFFFFCS